MTQGSKDTNTTGTEYRRYDAETQTTVAFSPVEERSSGSGGGYMAPPRSQAVTSGRYAAGVLDVVNASAVHWRLIDSTDGHIIDELWLTK